KSRILKKIIAESEDKKEIDNAQKLLIAHTNDRKAYFQNIYTAFQSNYTVSPVVFLADSLITELYSGTTSGIFYGKDGQVDPEIKIKTDSFIILGRGSRDDDFLILNSEGKPFGPPV